MRRTMKVLGLAMLLGIVSGAPRDARAAQACPDECRERWAEVICTRQVVTDDDEVVRVIYTFWSNGANGGVN